MLGNKFHGDGVTFNLFTKYTKCLSPGFTFKAEPPAIA